MMDEATFKTRTKALGLRVIRLVASLPFTREADVIGRQLVKCGTSVGANYRAACRGRSVAEMLAKLGTVEEEADETLYWLEMLVEARIVPARKLKDLVAEANEILAMVVASIKTLRAKQSRIQNPNSKIVHG